MLWKECVPLEFHKYICSEENFLYLNRKNVFYAKMSEIVVNFIKMDTENFPLLRNSLWPFKNIFQYVYSSTYPDIYCATEQGRRNIKNSFYIVHKNYKDKKSKNIQERTPKHFAVERQNSLENEQKPVKIDDFNSDGAKRMKESIEEKKRKKHGQTEKNKALKKKKRVEKEKVDEAELWKWLKNVNEEFKKIKDAKKAPKMSKTILK